MLTIHLAYLHHDDEPAFDDNLDQFAVKQPHSGMSKPPGISLRMQSHAPTGGYKLEGFTLSQKSQILDHAREEYLYM